MNKKKYRWMDSLVVPSRKGRATVGELRFFAIADLVGALWAFERGDRAGMHQCLARAGGYIVAWRKLREARGDRSERREASMPGHGAPHEIGYCIRQISYYDMDAYDLRGAEAVLRSIWKESQL